MTARCESCGADVEVTDGALDLHFLELTEMTVCDGSYAQVPVCGDPHPTLVGVTCEKVPEHVTVAGSRHRSERTYTVGYLHTDAVTWPGPIPAEPTVYDDPPIEELT